jgi:hypothetical protein
LDDLQRWRDQEQYKKWKSGDIDEEEEEETLEDVEDNPLAITDKDDDVFRHFFSTNFALFDTEVSGNTLFFT